MSKEYPTPEKMPWLKRLYGESISPREVILTLIVIGLALSMLGVI